MAKEPVFVHIPKTGGLSILPVCAQHGVKVLGHDLRNPNHVSLAQYKAEHPNIHSFAIVRNPWERVVSSYNFLKDGGIRAGDKEDADRFIRPYRNFTEFVLKGFQNKDVLSQIHFRPQYEWLSDEHGLIVDQVGRFEKLQLHFSRWCTMNGWKAAKLQHANKGKHGPYKQYYEDKAIEVIREIYRQDIELFKYRF